MSAFDPKRAQRQEADALLTQIATYCEHAAAGERAGADHGAALPDGHAGLRFPGAEGAGLRAADRAGRAGCRHCPVAPACRVPHWNWIRCRARLPSARWSAGWTSTTPGLAPSGATRRTISAAFLPLPITSRAMALMQGRAPLTVSDVLTAMVRAHEIQGCAGADQQFQPRGSGPRAAGACGDHRGRHRPARRVVCTDHQCALQCLGRRRRPARYRHAPNTGSRKSWAAGDATSRGVRHALMALTGEMGYPSVLSAPRWGFQDVLFDGKALSVPQPFGSYVMEKHPLQDFLAGGIPCADGRGMRPVAACAGARPAR